MIEWRPCTEQDIDQINIDAETMILADTLKRDLSHSVSMIVDGEVVASAGAQILYEGVAEVWALLSRKAIAKHSLSLTRKTKEWLDEFQESNHVVRVQAMCAQEDAYTSWLEVLGFEQEGLMRSVSPGGLDDYWLYGRVRKWLS